MPDTRIVTASVKENVAYMNQILPVKDSFDLVQRDLVIGEREASFFFIDGFMKDEVMLKIMDSFLSVTKGDMPGSATGFARQCLPYVEVDTVSDFDPVLRNLLSGTTCLFIDGYESCIVIDCRTYPARNVGEPERTNPCGAPGTALWRPSSSTQPSYAAGSATLISSCRCWRSAPARGQTWRSAICLTARMKLS